MQNSKLERLGIDLEHYKTTKKGGEKKVSLNISVDKSPAVRQSIASKHDVNMTMELNDSFIFKESPTKNADVCSQDRKQASPSIKSRGSSRFRARQLKQTVSSEVQCTDLLSLNQIEDLQFENQKLKLELEKIKKQPAQVLSDSETV